MKHVALVTCFLNNYGACLQALALQKEIERNGCTCDILAYIEPQGYEEETFELALNLRINSFLRDIYYFVKRKKKTNFFKSKLRFFNFRKKYLNFALDKQTGKIKYYSSIKEMQNVAKDYDAFVCGSDQIWNPTFYNKNNAVYFLRFAGEKRRISYAPSIGLAEIPEKYREEFITFVNDFQFLSVREKAGAEIIKSLCGRNAKVVLDPTLLAGPDFWKSVTNKRFVPPYKKYIFCYIFSNTQKCSEYLKKVQAKTNLPIVYLNISDLSYNDFDSTCKLHVDPIEFLQLIKNAEFVVTDSFHGTAFSLLFNKELYVFKRERNGETINMYSRIESILGLVNLEERVVSLDEAFEIKPKTDYVSVNLKMEEIRKESSSYLHNALFGENQ